MTDSRESELLASVPTGLLINGEWRVCFGVTEPDAGLNTLSLKTFARKDANAGVYHATLKMMVQGPLAALSTQGLREIMTLGNLASNECSKQRSLIHGHC